MWAIGQVALLGSHSRTLGLSIWVWISQFRWASRKYWKVILKWYFLSLSNTEANATGQSLLPHIHMCRLAYTCVDWLTSFVLRNTCVDAIVSWPPSAPVPLLIGYRLSSFMLCTLKFNILWALASTWKKEEWKFAQKILNFFPWTFQTFFVSSISKFAPVTQNYI